MTSKNNKQTYNEPQDLGLKVGTKEEAAWTDIKRRAETEVVQAKREIIINEEIIKLCKRKIEEEQGKV